MPSKLKTTEAGCPIFETGSFSDYYNDHYKTFLRQKRIARVLDPEIVIYGGGGYVYRGFLIKPPVTVTHDGKQGGVTITPATDMVPCGSRMWR